MYHTASFPKLHHAKREKGKRKTHVLLVHTPQKREREGERERKKSVA
jgi:hypothetical protein